ncbi:MAG: hypothetical protein JO022_11670, partial [Acidobacteriaceae bacterium]|nr:hypothetical protein [Acidobacteriaceae bacterium]
MGQYFNTRWLILACAVPVWAQVSVLTYQYDNSRAGANTNETILSPGDVSSRTFGKLFTQSVDRAVYGQPLYVPRVAIPGKGTHNVVYGATEHDSVYAFDADSNTGSNSAPLWQVNFLNAAAGVSSVPAQDVGCSQISPEMGITSTPVIDISSGTIYVVAMTKESSGGIVNYVHRLHALDIATGAEKFGGPVVIQGSYSGTGEGGSTLTFQAKNYKQRPGLLMLNGVLYTAWSSHCDIGKYHGWIMAYDAHTLQQVAIYNNTPNGNEGSFWAGGAAPAADEGGNIYVVAGNGSFDPPGGPNLGESFIKLSTANGLTASDFFAPFNYASLNANDADTGSAGVALLGGEAGSPAHPHLMVGAGKEGRIYLLDRDALGKYQPDADSQIVQSIAGAIGPLFGNPAYFNQTVYLCGSGDSLKAFPISNAHMATTAVSQSGTKFAFPGCVPTISANGTLNGIVWILEAAGVLHAYDASNVASELFNSNQNGGRDTLGGYVKFSVPMVANGKVYAGSQSSIAVYGLLSTVRAVNAASGDPADVAPGSIFSIFGGGLAQSTAAANSFPLPASLGGTEVTVNGTAAPLFYASPAQINAQMPIGIAAGTATINVKAGGSTVASTTITVQNTAPGIFVVGQNHAAALNQDGSVNSTAQPAAAGSVVVVYATGLGPVTNPVDTGSAASVSVLSKVQARVTATVGGQDADVQFAGLAPGFAGLYQVNVVVPQLSPGDYP